MKKSKGEGVNFNLLRILSSLAFLSPDDIIPTFRKVKTKYCNASNRQFFKYFESFWIRKVRKLRIFLDFIFLHNFGNRSGQQDFPYSDATKQRTMSQSRFTHR